MARVDDLITNFKKHLEIPFRPGLPLSQRVWFLVYPPDDERRVRARMSARREALKRQPSERLSSSEISRLDLSISQVH